MQPPGGTLISYTIIIQYFFCFVKGISFACTINTLSCSNNAHFVFTFVLKLRKVQNTTTKIGNAIDKMGKM